MKRLLKRTLHAVYPAPSFPCALLSGFGRPEVIYLFWAQLFASFPGLPGDYLRIAYYHPTLEECSFDSRIQFVSFFAHPQARVSRSVYIGSYCVPGRASIGGRTQIASAVQILSDSKQHGRDTEGRIEGAEKGVVMAAIGAGSTVGAGSVVTKALPPGVVAAGSPARVIRLLTTRNQDGSPV